MSGIRQLIDRGSKKSRAAVISCLVLFSMLMTTGLVSAITQGYKTDDSSLRPGQVVSITASDANEGKVTVAKLDEPKSVIGVVTTVEDSVISITTSGLSLYVANDGEVEAYVSNVNGDVQSGDLLALSPLNGVLMKATETDPAIAQALENFSDNTPETYAITGGTSQDTKITKVKIDFSLKDFQNTGGAGASSLQRIGRSLIGKEVGELRLVVAMLILMLVLIVEGSIIYGAVTSSLTAIGRNPMAKTVIKKELARVLLTSIFVLALGVGAIYAILWI